MAAPAAPVVQALTDGTGISQITGSKVLKDFVLDILLAVPVALLAIKVTNSADALAAPIAAAFAIGDAVIRAVYRVILRWAQSPS